MFLFGNKTEVCIFGVVSFVIVLGGYAASLKSSGGVKVKKVDCSTLTGKVMCGYQGWFNAEGDGAGVGWIHYGKGAPRPGKCSIDLWPDMSEMDDNEIYATEFRHTDGSKAYLFSSYNSKTVMRHFQWMAQYGIDGVFVQRFGSSVRNSGRTVVRNTVLDNCRKGANAYGRVWALMYDLSGLKRGEIRSVVIEDWKRLVDKKAIRADSAYLHHSGKPVVAVWGVGFRDRDYTVAECDELVSFLKNDRRYGGNTVMLGLPTGWRELKRDAVRDKLLHQVIRKSDIVSPWTVGRYRNAIEVARHARQYTKPDMVWCAQNKKEYLPVVFPGFSWQNLKSMRGESAQLNQIPRRNGDFLWEQYAACKEAGATMVYQAMFDEIDEGTAIMKCSDNPPVGASRFVTNEGLPSDYYLWLVGEAARMIRGEFKTTHKPAGCR